MPSSTPSIQHPSRYSIKALTVFLLASCAKVVEPKQLSYVVNSSPRSLKLGVFQLDDPTQTCWHTDIPAAAAVYIETGFDGNFCQKNIAQLVLQDPSVNGTSCTVVTHNTDGPFRPGREYTAFLNSTNQQLQVNVTQGDASTPTITCGT